MNRITILKSKIIKCKNRIGLKNKDFTIISNNCWGGFIYQRFGLKYMSPFIGLFLFAPDYIELLINFDRVIFSKLEFIKVENSKYLNYIKVNEELPRYPIGLLNGNIEIHFLHYKSESEALEKWNKRVKRINFNNIIFKFSDRDLCNYECIKRFDDLKLENKICFTAKNYSNLKSIVWIKEFNNLDYVESEWEYYEKYVDIKKYLNSIKVK